jgi:hypothetical protein
MQQYWLHLSVPLTETLSPTPVLTLSRSVFCLNTKERIKVEKEEKGELCFIINIFCLIKFRSFIN